MTRKVIAVVTGSNRGIGKAIVEKLASTQHPIPLAIFATSRSGQALHINSQHGNEVFAAKLDISDSASISSFLQRDMIQQNGVDILVNNAGVNLDFDNDNMDTAERAFKTISINYEGTKQTCLAFLDSKGGRMASKAGSRIVNLSSAAASLHGYSTELQQSFRGVQTLSDVDALSKNYINAISTSTSEAKRQGWRMPCYSVSKAMINALTIVLAKSFANRDMLINCCDPGWVASDMGSLAGSPPKTEEEGARIPVKLAVGDVQSITGKFWGNPDVSSPADGQVLVW